MAIFDSRFDSKIESSAKASLTFAFFGFLSLIASYLFSNYWLTSIFLFTGLFLFYQSYSFSRVKRIGHRVITLGMIIITTFTPVARNGLIVPVLSSISAYTKVESPAFSQAIDWTIELLQPEKATLAYDILWSVLGTVLIMIGVYSLKDHPDPAHNITINAFPDPAELIVRDSE